ncbi:cupredoxin domain-containing protein [Kitasatospora sp. NPDC051853]|uniref:cupredoxin domain-containing protein n=1 Tax=Kitasatospora sp. NPDC051853 TaxID=3364058 RepID=UPI003798C96C
MHLSPSRALAATTAVALLMIAVGCSGSTGPATPASPSSAPATTGPAGSGTDNPTSAVNITVEDFAFAPADLTVAPGTRITVTNQDTTPHTLTSTGRAFDTGRIDAGQSATFTAPTTPGSYPYVCDIHPGMTGTLTVR